MNFASPAPNTPDAPDLVPPDSIHPLAPKLRGVLDRFKGPAMRLWLRVHELPVDADTPAVPTRVAARDTPVPAWMASGRGPTSRRIQFILVVESDPSLCQEIVLALEACGYFVLTARSVREASALFVIQPALLILDTHLSDALGWDLLNWLALCGRELPVVMVTGRESGAQGRAHSRSVLDMSQPCALEILVAIAQEHVLAPETAYGA